MQRTTTDNSHDSKTYLVTGAAGFIASKVCEFLLADGHTVVGVDNLNDAYDVRLKEWRLAQIQDHPNFTFYKLDVTDRTALAALFERSTVFNAIVNLAARAGVRQSVQNPWTYYETNVTGTLNLLELCREYDVPKFVLASTSSLYGKDNPMPYREDADTDRPLSPYAASKKAAETLCYTHHYLYDIDVTVFRYFTVYGPAGRPDMSLFRFTQWISEGRPVTIYGDGQQSRDFTYVDDIARGTIAGLRLFGEEKGGKGKKGKRRKGEKGEREKGEDGETGAGYEVINLGSDTPIVLMDAVRLIEELTGKDARLAFEPRHAADVRATWANIGTAERLLGWRPQTTFEQGVSRLVEWYQANREWAKDVRTLERPNV